MVVVEACGTCSSRESDRARPTAPAPAPRPVIVNDVDGDGFGDVVFGDATLGARLHLGSQHGLAPTPAFVWPRPDASAPMRIASASIRDFDGDGHADVALGIAKLGETCPAGRVVLHRGRLGGVDSST